MNITDPHTHAAALTIAFTGTRVGMTVRQHRALEQLLETYPPESWIKFVHGGCVGADSQFHAYTTAHLFRVHIYPSDIKGTQGATDDAEYVHTPLPALQRNRVMVEMADILFAAPQTLHEIVRSGTWSTVRHARAVGTPCIILDP